MCGFIEMVGESCSDKKRICPGGILQAEYNVIPKSMRKALEGMLTEMKRWMTGVMATGRKDGSIAFVGSPADQAFLVVAAIRRVRVPECFALRTPKVLSLPAALLLGVSLWPFVFEMIMATNSPQPRGRP